MGVSNLDVARGFYGDLLGLELVDALPFALVHDGPASQLRLTRVERVHAAPSPCSGGGSATSRPGRPARRRRRGLQPVRRYGPGRPRHLGRAQRRRIAWFLDPDGNTLSLTG
ncbi:MAG: VOC family protein [Nocardioides sp.]